MMYNIIKLNPTVNKKNKHWSSGFYSRNSRLAYIRNKIHFIYHIKR